MPLLDALLEEAVLPVALRQLLYHPPAAPDIGLAEIFLTIRTDGATGDGSMLNPFAANTAQQFNAIMFKYGFYQNMSIHLGPGLFRTEGSVNSGTGNPVILAAGTKITGAGMFNTVLRVEALSAITSGTRVFHALTDLNGNAPDIEISDLTIDCNLGNQPNSPTFDFARAAVGAIHLNGKNCRIRRVRVINFGTRTPPIINGVDQGGNTQECFVLWNVGDGSVTEDCIIEQPFESTARETTICSTGGKGAMLRNNYWNGDFVNPRNGFPTAVTAISSDNASPTATITVRTRFFHNVKKDDYILFKASSLPSEFQNLRFKVTSPTTNDGTSRDLQFTMATPASLPALAGLTVEQSFPQTMRVKGITLFPGATNRLRVTTVVPHLRQAGTDADWIALTGAEFEKDNTNNLVDAFNGTYQVDQVLTDYEFSVVIHDLPSGVSTNPRGEIWLDRRSSFVNISGTALAYPPVSPFTLGTAVPHLRKKGEWIGVNASEKNWPGIRRANFENN